MTNDKIQMTNEIQMTKFKYRNNNLFCHLSFKFCASIVICALSFVIYFSSLFAQDTADFYGIKMKSESFAKGLKFDTQSSELKFLNADQAGFDKDIYALGHLEFSAGAVKGFKVTVFNRTDEALAAGSIFREFTVVTQDGRRYIFGEAFALFREDTVEPARSASFNISFGNIFLKKEDIQKIICSFDMGNVKIVLLPVPKMREEGRGKREEDKKKEEKKEAAKIAEPKKAAPPEIRKQEGKKEEVKKIVPKKVEEAKPKKQEIKKEEAKPKKPEAKKQEARPAQKKQEEPVKKKTWPKTNFWWGSKQKTEVRSQKTEIKPAEGRVRQSSSGGKQEVGGKKQETKTERMKKEEPKRTEVPKAKKQEVKKEQPKKPEAKKQETMKPEAKPLEKPVRVSATVRLTEEIQVPRQEEPGKNKTWPKINFWWGSKQKTEDRSQKTEVKKQEVKQPAKKEIKKEEPKKAELKKIEPEKIVAKKPEPKKIEPKKPEPKKSEPKGIEIKKAEKKQEVPKPPAALRTSAQVVSVDLENGFLVANVGTDDGLKAGRELAVLRKGRFIGKAVVKKLRPGASAAVILPERWTSEPIQAGDSVTLA